MKKYLMVPLLAAIAFGASAQSVEQFSMSVLEKMSVKEKSDSQFVSINQNAKYSATVAMEAEDLAKLNVDTRIIMESDYADDLSFDFSDDPNYTPGATSVSISESGYDGPFLEKKKITADWSTGAFVVSYSSSFSAKGDLSSIKSKIADVPKSPKSELSHIVFEQGGLPVLSATVNYEIAGEHKITEQVSVTGEESVSRTFKVRSGALLPFVAP